MNHAFNQVVKMSALYAPTLKETPVEAVIPSHILLLRAGMIRKTAAGIYTFMPLGYRVLTKISDIVREEMDAIGAQEIIMPALQPAELWHESGRWDNYGPELMRLIDRHDHGFCLGPTHEEVVTALVRNELRSYKELPVSLYQIQTKYRDEIRPRFGLLRGREFLMKDSYSFNADQASLQETYDDYLYAYARVCERLGLDYRVVAADTGQIGGSASDEFMALAESGEAELVYCDCGYASDVEAAKSRITVLPSEHEQLEKFATPGVHTIAELAAFEGVPENATVKALSVKDQEGAISVLFVPGDHEVNEIKAAAVVPRFEILSDEDMHEAGLNKGSMGPVGLPAGIRVIADVSLKNSPSWLVGANEDGFHFRGAHPGRDFEVDEWADLASAKVGDLCPRCGEPLQGARGIEVSQIFQLGDKYSKAMGATYMAEDGTEKPFVMGCYGIGISRSLAAVVEQYNDDKGIRWPVSIAPYEVCVIPLSVGDDVLEPVANRIATELASIGVETVIDDRDERPGVKFNDADLYGWPYQITVGKRGVANGEVEIKTRETGEKVSCPIDDAVKTVSALVFEQRERFAFTQRY